MPPPVLTAPAGGDVNRGDSLLVILSVTTGLAALFVLSRLYVCLVITKWHWWDDYLIVVSIVRSPTSFDFRKNGYPYVL
jgi:hypothetical protein